MQNWVPSIKQTYCKIKRINSAYYAYALRKCVRGRRLSFSDEAPKCARHKVCGFSNLSYQRSNSFGANCDQSRVRGLNR